MLEQLGQIRAPGPYDNGCRMTCCSSVTSTFSTRPDRHGLPGQENGEPVAVILRFWQRCAVTTATSDLLAGIHADGSLSGVRVTHHKETPGLGDVIEAEKSDWVLDFTGRSLQAPALRVGRQKRWR